MNFLSHFYFDQHVTDRYYILGTVLPDLLKNADKNIILHPEKLKHTDPHINSIIAGWKMHLEIDRHFHSSAFFATHSHQLKLELSPVIEGSPVKPFFLGHIAIELILDNLLITTNKINVHHFYERLNDCDHAIIEKFLTFAGLKDSSAFFKFFEIFKREGYLHSYADTQQIAYALKRICMRVWQNPFTPLQETAMNEVLAAYRVQIMPNYMRIFDEITFKLSGTSSVD